MNSYDPFGIPGTSNTGRFQYTGQAWLAEIGLFHYKARMYSPTLGRFLQTDPIGYGDGMNMYRYVRNDPVNLIDPTGLQIVVVGPQVCRDVCYSGDQIGVLLRDLNFDLADLGSDWDVIVVNGRRPARQGPELPQKGLLDYGKDLICGLPAISPGLGADLYAGAGGSLGGGLNIDIAKGQFGVTGSLAVGLGLGVAVGPGVNAGPSGSSVISANLAVGGGLALPVAPGVNVAGSAGYNVLGTDPGFSGGSIGRFGTPVGYVNGGANFGFNTPPLYDLGCKK